MQMRDQRKHRNVLVSDVALCAAANRSWCNMQLDWDDPHESGFPAESA